MPPRWPLSFTALAMLAALGCAGQALPRDRLSPRAAGPANAVAPSHPATLEGAWADLDASRYDDAERTFRSLSSASPNARLGLSRVLLVTGRLKLVEAVAAVGAGASEKDALALVCVRAEALDRLGKLDPAEQLLMTVASDPEAREARLLLGKIRLEQGRKSDASGPLLTLIDEYNRSAIDTKDPHALALVGRAAELLGSAQDANDAYNEAERAGAADARTLLWRAELFLDNYDPGHAQEVLTDLLSRAPHQPLALALMAEVKLASNLDFESAEIFAKAALTIDPSLAAAHFVLGGVALRDMDFAKADAFIDQGLSRTPRDLDLLSLRAAVRFLADDPKGFERAKKDVLDKNPRYSRLYQIVGDYADWEHRYDEIITMMREALLANPDDAKVRAQLGFNLIREGDDDGGKAALSRAFSEDPFNVRVFNTLNLYEKEIPRDYETVDHGRFKFRYRKDERAILDRYLPDLLGRAWEKMTKKYGFTPTTPVGVELYPSREQFAVRTSGLPQTFIQGVCFGRTLAAMSPKEEHFNIGMTVWHELAHVFHIQLSKSRVPRWFTEGLAEYETLVERPEWRREYDAELYAALESNRLPAVEDMNRAFSHAEGMDDMATAYYASTQVVGYIVERWGMPKIVKMLELWGQGLRTPKVFEDALGVSADQIDRDFRAALGKRLERYRGQFVAPTKPVDPGEAEKALSAAPNDPDVLAQAALAYMGSGDDERAKAAIDHALAIDPKHGLALWLRVQFKKTGNDRAGATKAVHAMLAAGHDGYSVELALADVTDDLAERKSALEKAQAFDPLKSAPPRQLAELADEAHDDDAEIAALRRYVTLEENDGEAYRRLMTLLLSRHDYDAAKEVGEAAIYVDMESAETHRLYAEALAGAADRTKAIFELETALLAETSPQALSRLHLRLAELLDQAGDHAKAAAHRKSAALLGRTGPI